MKPLVIVFAHRAYQAMFDMNLPYWEAHGAPIMVVSPIGHPVKTSHDQKEFGPLGSCGPQMITRFEETIGWVLSTNGHPLIASHYAFFECDSLCLTKELPLKCGLWGNTFKNIHSGYGMFQEDWVTWQYLNFPWIIDTESLEAMYRKMLDYADVQESGYVDRWIAVMAQAAGVPMVRFSPRGFSRGKIQHENPDDITELDRVIREGGTMFHGIKTQQDLDLIVSLRKKYFP